MPKSLTKIAHGFSINAVTGPWAINLTRNQTGILQNFQVLRNRSLGQGHEIDDLTANACAAAREGM